MSKHDKTYNSGIGTPRKNGLIGWCRKTYRINKAEAIELANEAIEWVYDSKEELATVALFLIFGSLIGNSHTHNHEEN
jgi:hypothetical protein